MHHSASAIAKHFRLNLQNKATPIHLQLNSFASEKIRENREKLNLIVETIILCGRQNITLRGHCDDASYYDDAKIYPGNLQELLANAEKRTLRGTFTKCSLVCNIQTQHTVPTCRSKAQYFCILTDEACDVSNVEQMPVILRFVESFTNIQEEFIGFIKCCEGMTENAIASTILKSIDDLGMNMKFCRGKDMMVQQTWQENVQEQIQSLHLNFQEYQTFTVAHIC